MAAAGIADIDILAFILAVVDIIRASLGFLAVGVGEDVVVASAADTGAHEYRAVGEFVGLRLVGTARNGSDIGVAEDGPVFAEVIAVASVFLLFTVLFRRWKNMILYAGPICPAAASAIF